MINWKQMNENEAKLFCWKKNDIYHQNSGFDEKFGCWINNDDEEKEREKKIDVLIMLF